MNEQQAKARAIAKKAGELAKVSPMGLMAKAGEIRQVLTDQCDLLIQLADTQAKLIGSLDYHQKQRFEAGQ